MEKYILTEEIIKNANRYIPIAEKQAYCNLIAPECLAQQKKDEQNKEGYKIFPLPGLWIEDQLQKQLYLMNIFLSEYLGIQLPDGVTPDVYDHYASSHIFNQMERLKGVSEIKDAVFDILSDFKEFRKMLDTAIYNERTNRNDSLDRLTETIRMITTPDNIKKALESVKESTEQTVELQEQANDLK